MKLKSSLPKWILLIIVSLSLSKSSILNTSNLEDTFKQCLASFQPQNDLKRCVGIGAINRLQSLDSSPEFDFVDGLTLSRDMSQEYREAYNYADQDPSNLRSIVDTFDHVFSKRAMRWDMSFLYPGLSMRVAPSVAPGGILEFVMDPHYEGINVQSVKEIGTGKLMARQFLLPMLLGFKFNISSLLPIMFGIIVIIAKKLVFFSKLALIVSSAVGLGTLLFNNGGASQYGDYTGHQGYYQNPHYHPTTFGSHYKGFNDEDIQYRQMDKLNLYGNIPAAFVARSNEDNLQKTGRNFAWDDNEKLKKINEDSA